MRRAFHILMVLLALTACRKDPMPEEQERDTPFPLVLPPGLPLPATPPDNPLTTASVQLGRALFFDERLSRDGTVSCASCHRPDHAFSDTLPLSRGIGGGIGMRNAPSLVNTAYAAPFFRDGGVPTLELQAIAPMHDPVEMGHSIHAAAAMLRDVPEYDRLSRTAYGKPMDASVLTRALASYQRTLIGGWSRFDRFRRGEASALTPSELRGWQLFSSAELNCAACHHGHDLTGHGFHNIGQYTAYADPGRERISLRPEDIGKFKTPTLRNIALTAPYMHDGSMSTLEEVIDHFASGGLPHPNRSPEMRNFALTPEEKAGLIAFLHSLTDERPTDQVP